MLSNIPILVGFLMIINAGFSIVQYRRFLTLQSEEGPESLAQGAGDVSGEEETSRITIPIDVQIEIVIGLLIGMLGTINKYTANLDSISHQEITGMQTRTAEVSNNMNRGSALRNL